MTDQRIREPGIAGWGRIGGLGAGGKGEVDCVVQGPQGSQMAQIICIHCGRTLPRRKATKDHVPSKFLLKQPFPANLATVRICSGCNNGSSQDEEYLAAFLGMMLTSGDDEQRHHNEAAIDSNVALQEKFEKAMGIDQSKGSARVFVEPDLDTLHKVIVKNARGHAHLAASSKSHFHTRKVLCCALESLPDEVWAKVMPPAFQWSVIQEGSYRFHIEVSGQTIVRSVISEYLYTETHLDVGPTPTSPQSTS